MGIGLGIYEEIDNKENDSTLLSFSLLSLGIGVGVGGVSNPLYFLLRFSWIVFKSVSLSDMKNDLNF
jgi:hypothetical protein